MPRSKGKDDIYRVAQLWTKRCLEQQASLLWPEASAWSVENLQRLWDAYIENPDESGDSFYEKWERQLKEEPLDVHRIAADLVVVYNLFPDNYYGSWKEEQVRKVSSWRLGEDPPAMADVLPALHAGGIGNPGMHYSVARPNQFAYLIKFSQRMISESVDTQDVDAVGALAKAVDSDMKLACFSAKNVLLHLLFPEHYEDIASRTHKKLIVKTFSQFTSGEEDVDQAIELIRRGLATDLGRTDFNFYDVDVEPLWNPEAKEPNEGYWIEKTNVKGRPDRESGPYAIGTALWSPEASRSGVDIYRHLREVKPGDVVLHLTDNEAFTGRSVVKEPYQEFGGVPDTEWGEGPSYIVPLKDYEELNPPLHRKIILDEDSEYQERLLNLLENGHKGLFYNRKAEFNQGAYFNPAPIELLGILNEAYRDVAGTDLVDLSEPPPPPEPVNPTLPLSDLADTTGLRESLLRKWVAAIKRKRQAIFYGPPGTGKTYIAERLAQHLIGEGEGFFQLVQFHPSYGYEDFIQGIRPRTDEEGELKYDIVPGRFLEFCRQAQKSEDPCVLIIDEINRANLSRVFGELMYLLEYRGRTVPLAGGGNLSIPENVLLIGTMNTADRSIALVDHALRRRFAFLALRPDYELLARYHEREETGFDVEGLVQVLGRVNQQINDPNYEVGITFFMHPQLEDEIESIWSMEILPYLEEFFFDQPEKVADFRWDKVRETILA